MVIGGIALPVVVAAIVELAKKAGFNSDYAPYLAGVLSVLSYAGTVFVQLMPQYEQPAIYVVQALVVFLAATGFYERAIKPLKR